MKPRTDFFFPDPALTAYDEICSIVLTLMYLFVISMLYRHLMAALVGAIFNIIELIRGRK